MPHSSAQRPPEYAQPHSQKNTPRNTPGPAPLPSFHPPTAQPPVQIAFSDPFHNRDPFLPPSQHQRRESYGHMNGAPLHHYPGERAWPHPQGPLEPPPPPPPPFGARNMPPPSPSSNPASFGPPRGPPTASPYPGSRELPAFGPRGGMSISSLIGGDTARNGPTSPKAATTHNSPTLKSPSGRSPQRPRSTSVRSDIGHTNRPLSPRHGEYARGYEGRPAHDHRFVPYPYGQQPNAAAFRQYQSSPTSTNGEPGLAGTAQAPPRPNSQPVGLPQARQDDYGRPLPAGPPELSGFRHYNNHGFRASEAPPQAGSDGHERRFGEELPRRMPSPDHARMAAMHQSSHAPGPYGPHEPHSGLFRPGYLSQGPHFEAQHAQLHEVRHRDPQQPSPAPSDHSVVDGRFRHFGPQIPSYYNEEKPRTEPPRRELEENAGNHRGLLNVSPDINRANGRGSPLPQAVQGAQPRPGLNGRDPSVKNEFGRMFSGLGSGVGGSGTPIAGFSANGVTTPSRMSPRVGENAEVMQSTEEDHAGDGTMSKRKTRRANDENDSIDGRNTPTAGQKTSKRAKTSHATHHHHHHQHAHAHHHHHHHHDEHAHHPASGFGTLKFPQGANGSQAGAAPAHHHHHHHGVHAHHHHHAKPHTVNAPELTVHDKALMQSIEKLPRKHLGSALYSTALSMASNKKTINDIKFAFDTTVLPIPRFEGKANCTFTVRVAREYLQMSDSDVSTSEEIAGGLEEICRRRALWGTGIYTDDSDVVAAAVHSGWIRGDFGEFNDDIRNLLDQEQREDSTLGDTTMLYEKPKEPIRIPPDLDMHVTVLLLPALQEYNSTVMHNLRSRSWGPDHDGMSFKIHSIEFVDEPRHTRFAERGSKGMKKRIKEEHAARQDAAETLLGLMNGGRSVQIGA
ncbi:hypothetical protein MBLNU457_g2875t1 [Dothideomycetes sp. NU457]